MKWIYWIMGACGVHYLWKNVISHIKITTSMDHQIGIIEKEHWENQVQSGAKVLLKGNEITQEHYLYLVEKINSGEAYSKYVTLELMLRGEPEIER